MVDTATFAVVTLAYIALTLFLGYLGWKRTKEAEDFLLAGRKVNPIIIGLSYGATFISTSAIVGFGGVAAQLGMGLIWLTVLNIAVGIMIAFIIFGKKTREIGFKLKAVTFSDLMGKRLKSPFMQYATGVIILISMPLYTAAIIVGGARFIQTTFSMDYNLAIIAFALVTFVYVVSGGLLAVMYTDAMQGALMLFGMTILLIATYIFLGGVTNANLQLTDMANLVPKALASQGMTGWTSMPVLGSPLWLTMITTIVLGVGIGVLAQPQLVVRFMTAKDTKSLNKATAIGGPFILMMTGVAFTVGALTNVYFYNTQGKIATAAVPQGNVDLIMPQYINQSMPEWFVVLFLLVLLAAAMSTLSSIFHTMGTSAGFDLWTHIKRSRYLPFKEDPNKEPKPSILVSRIAITVMMLVSVGLAFIMPPSIIARATAMFFGICACAFLPAFAYALYSKKPSAFVAKSSLVVGAVSWFIWTVLVHQAEAVPIGFSKALFGTNTVLSAPWTVVDPIVVGLPLAILALFIAWLIESRREKSAKISTA